VALLGVPLWLFSRSRHSKMRFRPTNPEKLAPSQALPGKKKVLSAAGKTTAPVRPPKIATILVAVRMV